MFHHPRTSTYFKGLVCLLGDAAHASLPNQAAGAGQGLEDALVLSRVLAQCHSSLSSSPKPREVMKKLRAAFEAYDEVRRPRAQHQVETAVECGRLYNLQHPCYDDDMEKIVDVLNHRFDWLWEHDLEGDVKLVENRYLELSKDNI
jgi:salicylate hydroxylase